MQKTIVILHGWRLSGLKYSDIQKIFQKRSYNVLSPDLPGSGEEKLPKGVMSINDYISFVLQFLKKNKLSQVILVGHSFGGRIAAKLTAKHPEFVEKLILTGAPVIKQKLSIKKRVLVCFARTIKKILLVSFGTDRMRKVLYCLLGEWDYYKAPKEMQETFKTIVAEDISPNLPLITVPTLVLWGENDTFVSKKIGQEIAKRIPNAKYEEIVGASHKLPYEQPEKFADAVLKFLSL